jgi:DNA-binding response OmpR family regulator
MTRVLIVEKEPVFCDAVADGVRAGLGAVVESVSTGQLGAAMIVKGGFDLAVIAGRLPDMSGLDLAGLAANENIPVLMISGDAEILLTLQRFGFQFLVKPFTISSLLQASSKAIDESQENIRQVRESAVKMHANTQLLRAAIARSRRFLDESEAKWRARGIVMRPALYDP